MTQTSRSSPAGVLREGKTAAIAQAAFAELAADGWRGLSIDRVAAAAGVSKATLYRRWESKEAMLVDLIVGVGREQVLPPDTGDLRADLLAYLREAALSLDHPLVGRIAPDVVAEMRRSPQLAAIIEERFRKPRRAALRASLRRGVRRGEVPADADLELMMDMLVAPLFMFGSLGQRLTPQRTERIVDAALRAFGCMSQPPGDGG